MGDGNLEVKVLLTRVGCGYSTTGLLCCNRFALSLFIFHFAFNALLGASVLVVIRDAPPPVDYLPLRAWQIGTTVRVLMLLRQTRFTNQLTHAFDGFFLFMFFYSFSVLVALLFSSSLLLFVSANIFDHCLRFLVLFTVNSRVFFPLSYYVYNIYFLRMLFLISFLSFFLFLALTIYI